MDLTQIRKRCDHIKVYGNAGNITELAGMIGQLAEVIQGSRAAPECSRHCPCPACLEEEIEKCFQCDAPVGELHLGTKFGFKINDDRFVFCSKTCYQTYFKMPNDDAAETRDGFAVYPNGTTVC